MNGSGNWNPINQPSPGSETGQAGSGGGRELPPSISPWGRDHLGLGRGFAPRGFILLLLILAGLLFTPGRGVAQVVVTCSPVDPVGNADLLCTGDPCVITGSFDVSDGCVFDFGTRAVRVKSGTISVGGGQMRFVVGSLVVESTGKLKAKGDTLTPAGVVDIESAGPVTVAGVIDVSGNSAGDAGIIGDEFLLTGDLLANGLGLDADGGLIDVEVTGSVTVQGTISAQGNAMSSGGSVFLSAGHNVTVSKSINVSGGAGDAGDVDMEAGDDILLSKPLFANGIENAGTGGQIDLAAGQDYLTGNVNDGGSLTIEGNIVALGDAFGTADNADCGDGGFISLAALGDILIGSGADIRANGAPPFCGGGTVVIDSTDLIMEEVGPLDGSVTLMGTGAIEAMGGGIEGFGGDVEITAGVDVVVDKTIDVSGSDSGGDILVEASRDTTVSKNLLSDAGSIFGAGGTVEVTAGNAVQGLLTITTNLVSADGGPLDAATSGGDIVLGGCDVVLNSGVRLRARGADPSGGSIEVAASNSLSVGNNAEFMANGGGMITLVHWPGSPPVLGTGVAFNPPVVLEATDVSARFPWCPFCGNARVDTGEECDDGNSTNGDCCASDCTVESSSLPGAVCDTGLPGACASGTEQCQAGSQVCVPDNSGSPEICDGVDNDCNGVVDEGNPGGGGACATGELGVCAAGTEQCQGGSLVCARNVDPSAEVCDGLDNDCNGAVDESCASPTPTPTPSPSVTPTPSPTPTPVGGVSGSFKAVVKCGKAIGKAASKFSKARQKALAKCVNEAFKCIQLDRTGDPSSCLAKAGKKCAKALNSFHNKAQPKFNQAINKGCPPEKNGRVMVPAEDLRNALGFAACIDDAAQGTSALSAVLSCVQDRLSCRSDEVSGTEAPRVTELLLMLAGNYPPLAPLIGGASTLHGGAIGFDCLPPSDSAGGDLGDPRGAGKAATKCQKAIITAGGKFDLKRIDILRKCIDAILPCVLEQDVSRKSTCLERAGKKCSKALAGMSKQRAKLRKTVAKKCASDKVLTGQLRGGDGLDFGDAELGLCGGVGVGSVSGPSDIAECLIRQHECAADDRMREVSPRLEELLSQVGQSLGSAFCP